VKKEPATVVLAEIRARRKKLLEMGKLVAGRRASLYAIQGVLKKYSPTCIALSEGQPYICCYINVESFSDPHLLEALEEVGRLVGGDWASEDYPQVELREFRLRQPWVSVEINARVSENSTKCRKVLVKTDSIPSNTYKFVCEGEEDGPQPSLQPVS